MSRKPNLLRDLKSLAEIQPDAAATERAVTKAEAALRRIAPEVSRSQPWAMRAVAAAAAAAFLIALGAYALGVFGSGRGLAFAQVQQQVANTKSVQYVRTRLNTLDGKKAEEETRRVMVLAPARMREDVTTKYYGQAQGPEHWIYVYDAREGKMISLYPERKQYSVDTEIDYIDAETGEVGSEQIMPDPTLDFYQAIRDVPSEKTMQLPERIIGGKKVVGFLVEGQVRHHFGLDTIKATYWVDIATRLPVRIEKSLHSRQSEAVIESEFVTSDIVFDAPLDLALFSTEPPKGYSNLAATTPQSETEGDAESNRGSRLGASLLATFAFAQVQQEVAKAKTVQYVETIRLMPADGERLDEQLVEQRKVAVLGDHLQRHDKQSKVTNKDGNEIANAGAHSISVFNAKTQRLLALFPEKREFVITDFSKPTPGNDFRPGVTFALYSQGGFYDLIRNVPEDKARKLPEKLLNGKPVVGFLVEEEQDHPMGTDHWQRTYWVDPTTKLPVQIEVRFRPTRGANKRGDDAISWTSLSKPRDMDDIVTDIVFDAPLDPALFSTDPPEGWTDLEKNARETGKESKPK